jgi:hypothetical protein
MSEPPFDDSHQNPFFDIILELNEIHVFSSLHPAKKFQMKICFKENTAARPKAQGNMGCCRRYERDWAKDERKKARSTPFLPLGCLTRKRHSHIFCGLSLMTMARRYRRFYCRRIEDVPMMTHEAESDVMTMYRARCILTIFALLGNILHSEFLAMIFRNFNFFLFSRLKSSV